MPGIFDLFRLTSSSRERARQAAQTPASIDPEPTVEPVEQPPSIEEKVLFEQEDAASTVSGMDEASRAFAFVCFDEMWQENGGRVVPVGPGREVYHAGVIRSPDQVREFPMFVSPRPEGCEDYSKMVDHSSGEVRSAMVAKTARALRLADFTQCSYEPGEPQKTPMGRLIDLVDPSKDKTRAHLAQAWCAERGLDGYERRDASELLIARPREALSNLETLSMEGFRSRYLETEDADRGDFARE